MRTVPEWEGKTDDTPVPARVRLRVFMRYNGICQECDRKLSSTDKWICDHIVAICNGGRNAECNLRLICDWCNKKYKTPADVAEKAKTYRKRKAHLGIKRKPRSRSLMGTVKSGWRHKISGTWERR